MIHMNHDPLQHLNPADLTLLNLLFFQGLDLRSCISTEPDTHPARRTYLTLLVWFGSPTIRAATSAILTLEAEKSAAADLLREDRARTALDYAVTITHRCLEAAVRLQSPDDPENADTLDRHARQLRLLARPLIRARRAAKSAAPHHTIPDAASSPSHEKTAAANPTSSSSLTNRKHNDTPNTDAIADSPTTPAPIDPILSSIHTRPTHIPSPHHSTISNLLNTAPITLPRSHHPPTSAAAKLLSSVGQLRCTT
jgi:hypothetical protein